MRYYPAVPNPLPVSGGGTGATSFTTGSVIFMGATAVSQLNSQFFYNPTTKQLSLGSTSSFSYAKQSLWSYYTDLGTINSPSATTIDNELDDFFGNYSLGTFVQYKVYGYRNINGQKYYSSVAVSIDYQTIFDFGSIYISWTGAAGLDGYKVWRAQGGSGFFTYSIDVSTATSLIDDTDATWNIDDIETGNPSQTFEALTVLNYYSVFGTGNFYGIYSPNGAGYLYKLGVGTPSSSLSTAVFQGANDGGFATYSQIEVRNTLGSPMLFFGDSNSGSTSAGTLNFIGTGNASGDFRGELTFINNNLGGDKRISTWRVVQGAGGTTTSDFYILTRNSGFGYNIYGNYLLNNGFGGITAPTAAVHMRAGTATANTAPMRFTSGAVLTVPVVGTVEFLTDNLYLTITTGTARKEFTLNDATLVSGRLPYTTTNGRLLTDADLTYNATTNTLTAVNVTVTGTLTASGASTNTASVTVDFGFASGEEGDIATATVAAAWVSAGTELVCNPFAVATATHDAEDYALEGITAYCTNISAGVGFDVIARAPNGTFGQYVIHILGV